MWLCLAGSGRTARQLPATMAGARQDMRTRIPSYYYTESAAAVRLSVGLAQARPNYVTDSAAAVGPPVGLAQARPNNNIICTYMYVHTPVMYIHVHIGSFQTAWEELPYFCWVFSYA